MTFGLVYASFSLPEWHFLKCLSLHPELVLLFFVKKMWAPSVILLPLCPVSLTHKNPQRRKIIHGMHPVGCKE